MSNKDSNQSSLKYRPDIDGLRAIAILSVVCFHAFPSTLRGGFTGVDIFFVISGFLISTIIIKQLSTNSFSLIGFYKKRILRIYPALLFSSISCCILGWFLLFPDELIQLGKHLAGSTVFITNFVLWSEDGYFDVIAETKPLLHLWSLAIEEQFYFFLPWSILFFLKRKNKNLKQGMIALTCFSLLSSAVYPYVSVAGSYYSPLGRFWEMLIGTLLAIIMLEQKEGPNRKNANIISNIGFVLLMAGFLLINKKRNFPGLWALLPTLGAALIIFARNNSWINQKILSNKFMVGIGLISYPLYLWHWILLAFARIIEGEVPHWITRLIIVAISFILAFITQYYIENPIRFKTKKPSIPLALLGASGIIGLFGILVMHQDGFPNRKMNNNKINMAHVQQQFEGPIWEFTNNALCTQKYPFPLADTFKWWFCIQNSKSSPDLILLGSSYANHYYPGFISVNSFKELNILSIGTCDAAWIEEHELNGAPKPGNPCAGKNKYLQQEFINQIITNHPIKNVVLSGFPNEFYEPDFIERLKKRIRFLEDNGIQVIVFHQHSKPIYDVKSCYSRPLRTAENSCKSLLGEYDALLKKIKGFENQILLNHPKVKFFNPNDTYCSEGVCSYLIDGMPMFRDQYHHFSRFASQRISQNFEKWIKENDLKL